MAVGDVIINSAKIGGLDLINGKAILSHADIYENILSEYGPICDIHVIDATDELGKNKINGSYNQDIEINYQLADSNLGGGSCSFKLKPHKNRNLDDRSISNEGSGHSKLYTIRGVSKEYLNSTGNNVQKKYDDQTSNIVKDIVKNNFKSDLQFDGESTKGKRQMTFNNEHPQSVIAKLYKEHVAQGCESSLFALFQQSDGNGNFKYAFKTFEKMFEQSPVVKLKQTTNLNDGKHTDNDKQNSILWFKASDMFFTESRALSKPAETTFNHTTHKIVYRKQQSPKFKSPDGQSVYEGEPSYTNEKNVRYVHDKANNKDKHITAVAKTKRESFISHLAQNAAELEVPGNPKITLGSIVELDIPKKVDRGSEAGETQFNGKALVVGIHHKIKPMGQTPRYTMVLRVVKSSYKDGGGGNA